MCSSHDKWILKGFRKGKRGEFSSTCVRYKDFLFYIISFSNNSNQFTPNIKWFRRKWSSFYLVFWSGSQISDVKYLLRITTRLWHKVSSTSLFFMSFCLFLPSYHVLPRVTYLLLRYLLMRSGSFWADPPCTWLPPLLKFSKCLPWTVD